MKEEKEIRSYRDDLRRLIEKAKKCGCPNCFVLFQASSMGISWLSWALGEGTPDQERAVEVVAAEVRRGCTQTEEVS